MLLSPQPFRAKVRCCFNYIDVSSAANAADGKAPPWRTTGRWALPLIHIRGSEASASSFARCLPLSRDGFSRTSRARIQQLLDRYPTTGAAWHLPGYSPLLFGARKTGNGRYAAQLSIPSPEGRGLSLHIGNYIVEEIAFQSYCDKISRAY